MKLKSVLGWLATGLFCLSSYSTPASARKLSFKRHIAPMFQRYCVSCHKPKYRWKRVKIKGKRKRVKVMVKKPAGQLDLRRKVAYKNIVDVQSKQAREGYNIVTSGEVALSYIIFKLNNQHKHPNVGGKGKKCPPKRTFSTWRIRRIMKWIKQGAKK